MSDMLMNMIDLLIDMDQFYDNDLIHLADAAYGAKFGANWQDTYTFGADEALK
jgi:hypothetical protein